MTLWTLLLISCSPDKSVPFASTVQGDHSSTEDNSVSNTNGDTGDSGNLQDSDSDSTGPLDNSLCEGRTVGTKVNECAVNFELPDKNGQPVRLHQFAGDVIFFDLSSYT